MKVSYSALWTRPCGREGSEDSKGAEGSKGCGGRLRRQFIKPL